VLISHSKKFIFIHVYKNAGTSVTAALLPFAATKWQQRLDRLMRRFNVSRFGPQPYATHVKACELVEEMGRKAFDSYFSFAIVRNPWDWQVSLYKFMLKDKAHFQHELVVGFGGFDEYIRWRVAEQVRFQKDFIYSRDGELLVDFVARFENIETDFLTICSRIGVSASLPKLNISNTKPYRQFYTEETKELVRLAFEPDISLFGYDF